MKSAKFLSSVTDDRQWQSRAAAAAIFCFLAMATVVVSGANLSSAASGSHASALFVLGDSSVDCGENSLFYPLFHNNRSLHPCRGSDSSLIPHFLAEKMGLPFTPPSNGQSGSTDGILKGLNFGSAVATILTPGSHEFQSLNHQLQQLLETFQVLELQFTPSKSHGFIQSSIVYLSLGKDDYIDHFLHNSSGIMLRFTGQEFARILVNQMTAAIKTLYGANVRKIVCTAILPLGCTPRTVWEWSNSMNHSRGGNGSRVCVKEVNGLVLGYNKLLKHQIMTLNKELPEATILFCDIYKGIMNIIKNPKKYGFTDVKTACCGLGVNGAVVGCLNMELACTDESTHVWWDFYNPTEEVNRVLANLAWSGKGRMKRICRPKTIKKLVSFSMSGSRTTI